MTRLIYIFVFAFALFCGWRLLVHWENVQNEENKRATSNEVKPENLQGMPQHLQASYDVACKRGTMVTRNWLKTYGHMVEDPRKAWIELDFCVSIARENPAEARRIFAEVKRRTSQSSPVWSRIKQLENTFE